MSLVFRTAREDDAPALYRIYSASMTSPHMAFDPCGPDEFRRIFAAMRRGGAMKVCESDGRLAGVYRLEMYEDRLSHVARISAVAVAPQVAGTGLAATMMHRAIEQAAERGASRIELTVAADNARAIAFWRKLGFEVEGRLRNYFSRRGEAGLFDELAMALLLPRGATADEQGVVSTETAPHYEWGRGCDGWHLADSDGLSVIQERMPPGASETRHRHAAARQVFYVLEGELRFELAAQTLRASESQAVRIPPGVPHRVWTTADGCGASFLVISQPTTRGDRTDA